MCAGLVGGAARALGRRELALALLDLLERHALVFRRLRFLVLDPCVEDRAEEDGGDRRCAPAANVCQTRAMLAEEMDVRADDVAEEPDAKHRRCDATNGR